MANYQCVIRTNYFHVKEPTLFRQFMTQVYGPEGPVELWEKKGPDGLPTFAFGTYGEISGLWNTAEGMSETVDESAYNEFIYYLQQHVHSHDAVIILKSGQEKLCHLIGSAEIITHSSYTCLDISELAQRYAADMLDDPGWQTEFTY